jgi:hypothetical protein
MESLPDDFLMLARRPILGPFSQFAKPSPDQA